MFHSVGLCAASKPLNSKPAQAVAGKEPCIPTGGGGQGSQSVSKRHTYGLGSTVDMVN